LVQKSGYLQDLQAPNDKDLELIIASIDLTVKVALNGQKWRYRSGRGCK